MTQTQKKALSRLEVYARTGAYDGWVHPKWIMKDRGIDVALLRSIISAGFAEETPIKSDPGFALRISNAGRAELST